MAVTIVKGSSRCRTRRAEEYPFGKKAKISWGGREGGKGKGRFFESVLAGSGEFAQLEKEN